MTTLQLTSVHSDDALFLHRLMNEPSILAVLNEVPTQLSDWQDAIEAWEQDPDEEDFLLRLDGTPVGWLGINGLLSDDSTVYLKMLVLLPGYQENGLGAAALRQILSSLRRRGYRSAALFTDRSNHRAQACYKKCGFAITEALSEEMSNGKTVERYQMTCSLV